MTQGPESEKSGSNRRTVVASRQLVIVLVVLAAFAGVLAAKAMTGRTGVAGTAPSTQTPAGTGVGTSTTTGNNAVADYEAALTSGKPVYVLFHSLTCQPCVEIAEVADKVIPDYAEKIAFVDAVTDDPSGRQLASKFSFQYIPQSFFLKPDGTTVDSFTGAMEESDMRARLDALIAKQ